MWWDGRMIKTKFVFAVSMVAMLSCGVAWASAPSGSETVAAEHDVYEVAENAGATNAATDLATGIAGVTYVNRMVNTAGNAAQLAEDHAAAAGAYAIRAETAANEAKNALGGKLDNKFNLDANKNAIVTTDKDGKVTPVAISDPGLGTYITDVTVSDNGAVTLSRGTPSISSSDVTDALGYTPEDVANKVKTVEEYQAAIADGTSASKYTSVAVVESKLGVLTAGTAGLETAIGDVTNMGDTFSDAGLDATDLISATVEVQDKANAYTDDAISNLNATVTAETNKVITAVVEEAGKLKSVTSSEVTKAMLASGIFGYIPTSSDGTGSAQIWVE